MNLVFSIALGGAIGVVARHYLSHRIALMMSSSFPFGTISVNILGSFIMGLLVMLFANKLALSQEMRAFLTVGLLGGFTTFSAFSLEAVLLMERGAMGQAALYIGGSVMFAIAGLFAGIALGKVVF